MVDDVKARAVRELLPVERRRLPEATSDTRLAEPASDEELLSILAQARRSGSTITPWGSGGRQRLGEAMPRVDRVVSLQRLQGIQIDGVLDGVVTVRAGTPLRDLRATLGAHGQTIGPIPVAREGSTVGGLVATGASGPHRLFRGGVRDAVLGLQVALVDGRRVQTGGRVMKNVAGYDLTRLFTGSLGTLGVVTTVHLRVWPRPPVRQSLIVRVKPQGGAADRPGREAIWRRLWEVGQALLERGLEPAALEIVEGQGFRPMPDSLADANGEGPLQGHSLWVDFFSGSRVAPRLGQETQAIATSLGCQVTLTLAEDAAEALWSEMETGLPERSVGQARFSLPTSLTVEGALQALRSLDDLGGRAARFAVAAGPGTGVGRIWLGHRTADLSPAVPSDAAPGSCSPGDRRVVVGAVQTLRAWVEGHRGALVLEDAPLWLRDAVGAFGTVGPKATLDLTRGLKRALDPDGLLSAGRMFAVAESRESTSQEG